MDHNEGRPQVRLGQLVTKFESCPPSTPISDVELLELHRSFHIRDKLATEAAMADPNLRRLVGLCNMSDAITLRLHQLYLKRMRADDIAMFGASPPQISLDSEKQGLKGSDGLSDAPRRCDNDSKSPPPRTHNIHLNF
ncbi:hypothetical protein K469DRAFT_707448 [Zopfia rhizophila CBS 207.26]|uniref:Uncharacterized protein n=1 Tax=Zopfia rhizophila CBS 207.26 TaxID=1314779 RepID=A0A6A6E1I3_9PEZI|nr:hypothetical protein K469DRAFT_707448 [Zopfia rhizophila CBS 207.26]